MRLHRPTILAVLPLLPLAAGCQPADYPPFGPDIQLQRTYLNELNVGFSDKHLRYSYPPHEFKVEQVTVVANGSQPVEVLEDHGLFRFTPPPDAQSLMLTAIVNDWDRRFRVRIGFTHSPQTSSFSWLSDKPEVKQLPPSGNIPDTPGGRQTPARTDPPTS